MAEKVLTKLSYIGGRLRLPGETVDVDDRDPTVVIKPASTPIGNMTDDELEAYMRRRKAQREAEGKSEPPALRNAVDAGSDQAPPPPVAVPIADISPRTAGSTQPQGLPAGATLVGGTPVKLAGAPGQPAEVFTGPDGERPNSAFDHDGDGKAGGSLTKDEIKAELDALGIEYPANATKPELQKLLSQGPNT